jgi:hypothetical protein
MIHGQNINLNPSFVAQRRNSLKFKPQGPEAEMTFHYYWRVKSVVLNWFEWNLYLPMQLTIMTFASGRQGKDNFHSSWFTYQSLTFSFVYDKGSSNLYFLQILKN